MTFIALTVYAVIAGSCGLVGQFISGYSRGGCPVSFVSGLIGALAGPWVALYFDQPELYILPIPNQHVPIVWSAAGALGLVLIVNFATRKRKF